jgi:hypothetical protein
VYRPEQSGTGTFFLLTTLKVPGTSSRGRERKMKKLVEETVKEIMGKMIEKGGFLPVHPVTDDEIAAQNHSIRYPGHPNLMYGEKCPICGKVIWGGTIDF